MLCIFCEQKDSMQRIFIKKCFLFTVRSVCCVKRFTTGWQTFHHWRRCWNGRAELAETTVKTFLCRGFRRTGKAMEQIYCNRFAQSVSRQRLGKHVPKCDNGKCVSVDECYSSVVGNSQRANELAGWDSRDLCFLCCRCWAYITKTCCSLD
jgi:hypothetical protein